MPLYSDLSLFGAPSSSSYSGLYSPGPYSNHSSLLSSTYRSPVYIKTLPRTFPRSFAPHLATISESQMISPIRRKFSPKLLLEHHSSPKFVAPKPIKINTADIDVSVNKYRKYDRKAGEVKVTPEKSPSPSRPEVRVEDEEEQTAKPIRRDRALVRLHTVHKKDSPRRNLQNGDAPKSWRHNFYPSEPKQVDKKPRRSPGELLMDKFLIRTKDEEERFRLEGRKLPRKASVKPNSSTFHEICRQISSEKISENLNPGQPAEVTRRQSKSNEEIMKDIRRNSTEILKENVLMLEEMLKDEHLIKEEDENNNTSRGSVKRKKKAAKKKSNEMLVLPEEQQLHRRATQKKVKRTSTDTSIPEDEEAYQMAIRDTTSQVEVEAIRAKPKFTATVEVEHSPSSPGLKAVVDKVEIVESPKLRTPGKFKFNVTIEGIEKKRYDDGQVDLPESQLKVLDSAIAMKREKSRSPAPREEGECRKGGDVVPQKIQVPGSKGAPKKNSSDKTQKINSKSEMPPASSTKCTPGATEASNLVSPADNKTSPVTPDSASETSKFGTTKTEVLPISGKSKPTTPPSQPDDARVTKLVTTKTAVLSENDKFRTSSPELTGALKLGPAKTLVSPVDDKTRPPSPPGAAAATKLDSTMTKVLSEEGKSKPTSPPGTVEPSKLNSRTIQVGKSGPTSPPGATKLGPTKTAVLPVDGKSDPTTPPSLPGSAATTKLDATTTKILPEKAESSKSSTGTTQAIKSEPTSPTKLGTTKTTGGKSEPVIPTSTVENIGESKTALVISGPNTDKSKGQNLTKQSDSNKRGLPRIAEMDEKSSPKFLKSPQTKIAPKSEPDAPASPGRDKKQAKITPKLPPKEENSSGEDFWRHINTRESVYWDARKRKHQEKRYATYIEEDEEEVEVPQSKVNNLGAKLDVANVLKVQEESDRQTESGKLGKRGANFLNDKEQGTTVAATEEFGARIESPKNKIFSENKDQVSAENDLSPKLAVVESPKDKSSSEQVKTTKVLPPTSKGKGDDMDSPKAESPKHDKARDKSVQDTSKVPSPISTSKDKAMTKLDLPKATEFSKDKLQDEKGQDTSKEPSPTLALKDKSISKLDSPKATESSKEKPRDDKGQDTSKVLSPATKDKGEAITSKPGSPKAVKPARGDRGQGLEVASKLPSPTSKDKDKSFKLDPKEKEMPVETGVRANQTMSESKVPSMNEGGEKLGVAKVLDPKETSVGTGQGAKTQLPNKASPEGQVKNKTDLASKSGVKKDVVELPIVDTSKTDRKGELVVKDRKGETVEKDGTVVKPAKLGILVTKDAKDETSSVQREPKKSKPEKPNETTTKPSTPTLSPTSKVASNCKDLEAPPKNAVPGTKLKSQDDKVGSPQLDQKLPADKKDARPKRQKINEVKPTDPLQSIVTDVHRQPLKAEVAASEEEDAVAKKKIVSKRSLVNKSLKDDPDLKEFIVPEEPPPSPRQKEPDPPSAPAFVPLQSNRLSQWMNPFKKPEQYEQCPVQIYARPKTIRGRHYPKPYAPESKKEESESEEEEDEGEEEEEEEKEGESTDGESESEESSEDEESVDYEAMNDVWGYGKVGASTSSDDSGFDSSSLDNRKNKDCDVNCHKKCEKLTAHLCGVNQKLIVEAIESVKRGCSERDSPTSNPAHNPAFALDPAELAEEFSQSTTFAGFQKSGRITPPATTIPRFRKYNVDDFNFLKVLGKGSFGKVLLAELKDTEYYYAIKCLKKDVVLEDDDVECTLIERKVLALGTKHPYLCHLLCTFQTESHLFFVMEYLNGGDLMFHIQLSGRFSEPRARFYAAEIVSGLKFLHSKGIVYRDLKLDNILLDFDGHVRIADFGMCKLQIFLDRTADTFCGTPDYMAPEIIKGQHYNQNVDWWSFGVLLYEMLIGQSPFSGCDEDELFWSICNERPVLPRFLSKEASSILTLFLEKDASKRLGNKFCQAGDIQDQSFFHPIAWDLLNLRQLEPPFKPNLLHPLDTQYFDRTFTVEKAKITPIDKNILQSMDQAQFQGFSYTNPNATDR